MKNQPSSCETRSLFMLIYHTAWKIFTVFLSHTSLIDMIHFWWIKEKAGKLQFSPLSPVKTEDWLLEEQKLLVPGRKKGRKRLLGGIRDTLLEQRGAPLTAPQQQYHLCWEGKQSYLPCPRRAADNYDSRKSDCNHTKQESSPCD